MSHALTEAAFAKALLDPAAPMPRGITTARGRPDAKRFAIYRNNVAVALSRAIAARFPVVRELVGADFFSGMIRTYIAGNKPSSPIITAYGDDFPDFVATFEPAKNVTYLADVARLEAAWTRAYHAADADPLAKAALTALDTVSLLEATLVPHPAATLLRCPCPAGSIWHAHQGEAVTRVTATGGECILIVRPAFEVSVHALPARDAPFAAALFAGSALGAAAALAAPLDPQFDFGSALVGLVSLGAFTAIADGVPHNV